MRNLRFDTRFALWLGLFLLVAGVLRLWFLGQHPMGFHHDEAFAGYNAWSVLKTGRTVHGHQLPLYLDTFGDYRPMGLIYAIVPSVALFGLNEFAVRLPAALMSLLSILAVAYLAWQLTRDKTVSLVAAGLLALSPWHIILSRSTSETVMAILLSLLASILVLKYRQTPHWSLLVAFYSCLTLLLFSYTAAGLFLLLWFPLLIWHGFELKPDRKSIRSARAMILVFGLFLIFPLGYMVGFGHAGGRAEQVISLVDHQLLSKIEIQLTEEDPALPLTYIRSLHNKYSEAFWAWGHRYLDYFNPNFLFFDGGLPHRYFIPHSGLISVLEVVGLLVMVLFWSKLRVTYPRFFLPVFWLLLAPIPASLTTDDHVNMSRASLMIPAIVLLAAIGLVSGYGQVRFWMKQWSQYLAQWVPGFGKTALSLAISVLSLGFITGLLAITTWHYLYFFDQYFIHQRHHEWLYRNFAARDVAKLLALVPESDAILATTHFLDTHVYTLFFAPIEPTAAQQAYARWDETTDLQLKNITFTNADACATKLDIGEDRYYDYFVDTAHCDEPDWAGVTWVPNPDGDVGAKVLYNRIISPQEWRRRLTTN